MTSLIYTLAVAQHLSFNRAALTLGTSQSSVSARIKQLEADLGILLFDRNTRGVRLTKAGHRFVDQVYDGVEILDRAIKTVGTQVRCEEGELWIGVHALTPGCFLARLLDRFHSQHPDVRLHFIEGTARDAQRMLREGRLDVAFMLYTHEIPDLNTRVIWRDRLMAVLSSRHSLAAKPNVAWRQLVDEIFLVRHAGTGPQLHDLIVARAIGKWLTPVIQRVDVERSALMAMIAAENGISLLAEEIAVATNANVVFRPIIDEPETVAFSAVWSPQNRDPALAELLTLAMKMAGRQLESDTP